MNTPRERTIKTTETVVAIVEYLLGEEGARLSAVADHADMATSTAHRHLATLVEQGLVVKREQEYYPSLKFLDYGGQLRQRQPIYTAAKPVVDELAEETGLTAHLAVEEAGQKVFLYTQQGDQGVDTGLAPMGRHDDLHTAALGKAIMAHLPEDRIDEILAERGLPAQTEATITDPAELKAELETVRERGYAISDEEEFDAIEGIGVPIVPDDEVAGAISVAGPKTTVDVNERAIREALLSASNTVELKMRYQ